MGFFYDEFFEFKDALAENFDKNVVKNILSEYDYNEEADQTEWFENIKALGEKHNFASDMKAYKAQPENYAGSVADVSGFIRLAVTGKNVSPDMYLVMKILGKEKVNERINKFVASL